VSDRCRHRASHSSLLEEPDADAPRESVV